MSGQRPTTLVIGAGIGGLCAAARLAASGHKVRVLERHAHPGGKMRVMDSPSGPIDAGPTVLTMRHVFDDLFASLGERLEDHLTLHRQHILARHWWADQNQLDLYDDPAKNIEAILKFSGAKDAAAFEKFAIDARRLFDAFDLPMMRSPAPRQRDLIKIVMRNPGLIRAMDPLRSLAATLDRRFDDLRLRQLFGRYATYVGGAPGQAPALLSLIWHAEASGVWTVKGGMHRLARALVTLIERHGGQIDYGAEVARIGNDASLTLTDGQQIAGDQIIFNGDPKALADGLLGPDVQSTVKQGNVAPRSLSAYVWSFSAKPAGHDLAHHNVFFADAPNSEFRDIEVGQMPKDPTLYLCAQDAGITGAGRFEIIMNGAATDSAAPIEEEFATCQRLVFDRLARMGLSFDQIPSRDALTTPSDFAKLFPASQGALYGRSPHGLTAGLKRPLARTKFPHLYLAGGGAHPGAGVPMAALSGQHAAEAILSDLGSMSRSARTATPGGMWTGSARMDRKRSPSSAL